MKNTEENKQILGIDTSNYKTSVALTDLNGKILSDFRELLKVKQGERGLRQSDALFQHTDRLPALLEAAFARKTENAGRLCAVAVSTRPRPVAGSYMPVFKAGICAARAAGAACGIPVYEFSHQEGHLAAAAASCAFDDSAPFLAYHLSGGTCELLRVERRAGGAGYEIERIGGTLDISFGQVLDRVGVQMGIPFPAGEEMDRLAMRARDAGTQTALLKRIPLSGLFINLSGIDTQCRKAAEQIGADEAPALIGELFTRIGQALVRLTERAADETGIRRFLFSGGVASSRYLRDFLRKPAEERGISVFFGTPEMSADNAVGIALLGGKMYGNETR